MRLPRRVANPCLAALVEGAGFPSLERFATAVNLRGWQMHGVKLNYDHVSVKRWLAGGVCQNPDVVAAVLSDAWGIPIPVATIWPGLRDGEAPIPAHLQAWVATRTLEDLGIFLRSDMLTRRETLAGAVGVVAGGALVDPIARWLGAASAGLEAGDERPRIGTADVVGIERSTRYFAATDAEVGGGLSREAAVGQLKYAVDLARYGSYRAAVGNQLLAAIAELSGMVGWMCHDSGMPGPAQRYLVYGLQAAHESTDERAPLLVISILADMARQMRWTGHPDTALRLLDLALDRLPKDRRRFNAVRSLLWSQKGWALACLNSSCLPEVRNALSLAFDLNAEAGAEERHEVQRMLHLRPSLSASEAELADTAAASYQALSAENPRMAREAERHTMEALGRHGSGCGRNKVLSRIRLARARFVGGEPEQASDDGDQAITMAADTPASAMVRTRLGELLGDSAAYRELPRVRDFRERLQLALAR
jgi:hypothetical protein